MIDFYYSDDYNKWKPNNSYVEKWRDGPYETSATSYETKGAKSCR